MTKERKSTDILILGLSPMLNFYVSFCAWSDAFFSKDEKIAVYGQGNWAANLALIARKFSGEVAIINPEPALQLAPFMQQELSGKKLKMLNDARIRTVKKNLQLDQIEVTFQASTGATQALPFKVLFMGENLCLSSSSAALGNSLSVVRVHTVVDLNSFDHYALYEKGRWLAGRL